MVGRGNAEVLGGSEIRLQKNVLFSKGEVVIKVGDYEFYDEDIQLGSGDTVKIKRNITKIARGAEEVFYEVEVTRSGRVMTGEQSGIKKSTIRNGVVTLQISRKIFEAKINTQSSSIATQSGDIVGKIRKIV